MKSTDPMRWLFPSASQSFREANPAISGQLPKENPVQPVVERRRGKMNKTEGEFSMILEARKRKGEIIRYEFEGITLRFAGVKYTPDFLVITETGSTAMNLSERFDRGIKLIEIKGPFIRGNRERAVERFRHARTYWPEFAFECHQKTKDGWKQIL